MTAGRNSSGRSRSNSISSVGSSGSSNSEKWYCVCVATNLPNIRKEWEWLLQYTQTKATDFNVSNASNNNNNSNNNNSGVSGSGDMNESEKDFYAFLLTKFEGV